MQQHQTTSPASQGPHIAQQTSVWSILSPPHASQSSQPDFGAATRMGKFLPLAPARRSTVASTATGKGVVSAVHRRHRRAGQRRCNFILAVRRKNTAPFLAQQAPARRSAAGVDPWTGGKLWGCRLQGPRRHTPLLTPADASAADLSCTCTLPCRRAWPSKVRPGAQQRLPGIR
jgi:phage baseplate assembly protein W